MKFYGIDIQDSHCISKHGYDLLGQTLADGLKAYIRSLVDAKEDGGGARFSQTVFGNDFIGDVVSHPDDFFPGGGFGESDAPVDNVSMLGLIDGGNYWVEKSDMIEGRFTAAGVSLTTDKCITACGRNASIAQMATVERFSLSDNIWTSRTDCNEGLRTTAGCAMTSDTGIKNTGMRTGGAVRNYPAERYIDSANTWTNRSTMTIVRNSATCFPHTSDVSLWCGGYGAGYLNSAESFSESGNSFTSKSTMRHTCSGMAGFSLNSDQGLIEGGWNGTYYLAQADRFTLSSNTWNQMSDCTSSKTIEARTGMALAGGGVAVGGYFSTPSMSNVDKFISGTNSWIARANMPRVNRTSTGSTFTADTAFVSGGLVIDGGTPLANSCMFKDTVSNSFDGGKTLSSYKHPNNDIPYDNKNVIETRNLKEDTTQIKGIVVSTLNQKTDSTQEITVDVSFSGGQLYELTDQPINDFIDTSLGTESGGWTMVTDIPEAKDGPSSFGLTSDLGVCAGGHNGTGICYEAYRYSDAGDSWTARTNKNHRKSAHPASFNLDSNYGIMAAGNNNSGNTKVVEKYSDSGNSWENRSDCNDYQRWTAGFPLTSDLGIMNGGYNNTQVNDRVERHSDSGNSWTNRTAMTASRNYHDSFGLTSDIGVVAAGMDGSNTTQKTTWSHSDSGNSWTVKTELPSERYSNCFSLDSNNGIIASGSTSIGGEKLDNTQRFSFSDNTWSSRDNCQTHVLQSSGLSLDTDIGLLCGGIVESKRVPFAQRFDDLYSVPALEPAGIWTSRASCIATSQYAGGLEITTDTGCLCHTSVERYSNSANDWTARTSMTLGSNEYVGTFNLTSNLGMRAGGNSGGTPLIGSERYDDGANSWTARTNMNYATYSPADFKLNADQGIISGGRNGSNNPKTQRYNDSSNNWTNRTDTGVILGYTKGFELNSDTGLKCGGWISSSNPSGLVERFSDSANSWTARGSLGIARYDGGTFPLTSGKGMVAGGVDGDGLYLRTPERYDDLSNIWVYRGSSSLIGKYSNGGFALNDGQGLSGGGYDGALGLWADRYTDFNLDGVAPPQHLTLKFNIPRDVQGDSWSSRANVNTPRYGHTGFGLTSDSGITAGGNNGSTLGTTERHSDSGNSWSSRSDLNTSRFYLSGFSLTSDHGITVGGGYATTTERYSDNANFWLNRTGIGTGRNTPASASLTSDTGITFCGYTPTFLKSSERYSDSLNSWTSRSDLGTVCLDLAGFSLSSNNCMKAGGEGAGEVTERYSDSDNTWTVRTDLIVSRFALTGIGYSSNQGLVPSGYVSPNKKKTTEKYYDFSNTWTLKSDLNIERYFSSGFTVSSGKCILATGNNGSDLDSTERYTDGETNFEAFGVQTIY